MQKIFGGEYPQNPPTNKRDITPNFLLPTTIYHFSTLGIVWSLFVDGPPTDEFLKNALPVSALRLREVSYREVLSEIKSLRSGCSCGPDGNPVKYIKMVAEQLVSPIS